MNKKKIGFIIVIILIIILGFYLIFGNNIKAYNNGVDVKYFDNPKYCVQDSECVPNWDMCFAINVYNYKNGLEGKGGCMREYWGTSCVNNNCKLNSEDEKITIGS